MRGAGGTEMYSRFRAIKARFLLPGLSQAILAWGVISARFAAFIRVARSCHAPVGVSFLPDVFARTAVFNRGFQRCAEHSMVELTEIVEYLKAFR